MMILGIMLVTALSVSLVSLKERKTAMSGSKSGQAFQNAQSGVELVMQAVVKGGLDTVNQIAGAVGDVTCSDGLIKNTSVPYTVELRDIDDKKIACNSTDDISTIASIKSIGAGGDSQRAIQAAVAASSVIYCKTETADEIVNVYGRIFLFELSDCGGMLPDNSYIGMGSDVRADNGVATWAVIQPGESISGYDGPGMYAFLDEPAGDYFMAAVFIKK